MHNSLSHIFDIVMPSISVVFILSLTTCTKTVTTPASRSQDLVNHPDISIEQIDDIPSQQKDMKQRLRDIEEKLKDGK